MKSTNAVLLLLGTLLATAGPALAATDKYQITAEEHAACDGDAVRFCAYTYPDEDRLLSCMKANKDQLVPVCLSALRAGMRRRHLAM